MSKPGQTTSVAPLENPAPLTLAQALDLLRPATARHLQAIPLSVVARALCAAGRTRPSEIDRVFDLDTSAASGAAGGSR